MMIPAGTPSSHNKNPRAIPITPLNNVIKLLLCYVPQKAYQQGFDIKGENQELERLQAVTQILFETLSGDISF